MAYGFEKQNKREKERKILDRDVWSCFAISYFRGKKIIAIGRNEIEMEKRGRDITVSHVCMSSIPQFCLLKLC